MSTLALLITIACGTSALALAFQGTYWLGARNALRELASELLDHELAAILEDEDDDGGIRTGAPA